MTKVLLLLILILLLFNPIILTTIMTTTSNLATISGDILLRGGDRAVVPCQLCPFPFQHPLLRGGGEYLYLCSPSYLSLSLSLLWWGFLAWGGGGCEVVFRFCLFNYDSKGRYHDIKHWRLAAGRKARMFWCSCLTKLWRTRFLLFTELFESCLSMSSKVVKNITEFDYTMAINYLPSESTRWYPKLKFWHCTFKRNDQMTNW